MVNLEQLVEDLEWKSGFYSSMCLDSTSKAVENHWKGIFFNCIYWGAIN